MTAQKFPKIAGFQLIAQIGGGGFSTVYQAVHMASHRVAACKHILLTPTTDPKARKTIDKEIRVHSQLKHDFVLEFLDAAVVEPDGGKGKWVPGYYMLMELAAGGDLFDKIVPDLGLTSPLAQHYFSQLTAAVQFIHGKGVCHRDLKPENLLLDAAGNLKLADFGLAAVFALDGPAGSRKTRPLSERCGSLPYVAPELGLPENVTYAAEPVDWWGVGVCLFTMLCGNTPWDEPSANAPEYNRYIAGTIFQEEPWCKLSREELSLITGLLNPDPGQRFTYNDVRNHTWCTRPNEVSSQSSQALAESLSAPLRANGDLDVAEGGLSPPPDVDGDEMMLSAGPAQSQFTQSLLLFSQTQNGRRYTPHLTRFYASLPPAALAPVVRAALIALGVKVKDDVSPVRDADAMATDDDSPSPVSALRMRVGGYDRRKEKFHGSVVLEPFARGGKDGATFCVLQRDSGNPISWRQLWKALIKSPQVEPHVLRK